MDKASSNAPSLSMQVEAVESWLPELLRWLPAQLPIKDFVPYNILQAFQHRPYGMAVEEASLFHGAKAYESFAFYRERYARGDISEKALEQVLSDALPHRAEQETWRQRLLQGDLKEPVVPPGITVGGLRSKWKAEYDVDLDSLSHPIYFRLLSNFLDQGISLWEMPHYKNGFFSAVRELVQTAWLPLVPLSDQVLAGVWEMTEDQVISYCLHRIVANPEHHARYVLEMLFRHPGWSGMVAQVEANPSSLLSRRLITSKQAIAIELLIELGWLYRELGHDFSPLRSSEDFENGPSVLLELSEDQKSKALWHAAFERSLYLDFFSALTTSVRSGGKSIESPKVQTLFCIDDRMEGIRRHLEETWPEVETFSVAGFFGIDVMYQGVDDCYPAKHCPIVVNPKHLVRSRRVAGKKTKEKAQKYFPLDQHSNTLFRGWLTTQILGFWAAVKLALHVFRPTPSHATASSLSKVELDSELHLLRESDEVTSDGLQLGFTHAEMADRVAGLLKQIGLTKGFSELVVVTAHGASSTNNPHFAAYDCGACSGKPGAPNARAFAMMANDPLVRPLVAERGVVIPEHTHFLGAMHDTTRDEIVYFDEALVPQRLADLLTQYKAKFVRAAGLHARERCRRFLLLPKNIPVSAAVTEVKRRAAALFEPRSELDHQTNALLVIGRRKWTRGVFLDRRAFLNSYDPEQDLDGRILTGILSAAIPVCGGINLQYHFSRIDNQVYGSGTKLPHNVFGLIGVANGVEGDLRTGLASQMVEAHDPIRLFALVEQSPEVALAAARRDPAVWEWIEKEWVHYGCLDPKTQQIFMYSKGAMVPCASSDLHSIPVAKNSLDWALQGSENLPFCILQGSAT